MGFALFVLAAVLGAADKTPAYLKGVVAYNRPAPTMVSLPVTRDRRLCGDRVPDETLLIHKNGGLQNVLLFIANVIPETLPPLELNLETLACRFQPHVLALGVGSQLTIQNNDPMLHNVHAMLHEFEDGWDKTSTLHIFKDQAKSYFNFAFPAKNATAVQKMNRPGLLRLRSDAGHDWMSGYILVMPHRYFAVTDAEGKFEFPELLPARYDLILWHEKLGVKRQIVEVKPGEKKELMIKWFSDETASRAAANPDSTK
jgi:hypothetical protein